MLSFLDVQKVVNEDRLHRFELLYQPLKGGDNDSWWIRVKRREVRLIALGILCCLHCINRKKILD